MRRIIAVLLGLISAFFVFYFVRLLVITRGLRHLRPGGGGAYIGALAFPLIAIACGWGVARLWRRGAPAARMPTA